MTEPSSRRLVDRLPTGPLLMVTIFFTLAVALLQSLVWLGVGLVAAAVLWIVVLKILFARYKT